MGRDDDTNNCNDLIHYEAKYDDRRSMATMVLPQRRFRTPKNPKVQPAYVIASC